MIKVNSCCTPSSWYGQHFVRPSLQSQCPILNDSNHNHSHNLCITVEKILNTIVLYDVLSNDIFCVYYQDSNIKIPNILFAPNCFTQNTVHHYNNSCMIFSITYDRMCQMLHILKSLSNVTHQIGALHYTHNYAYFLYIVTLGTYSWNKKFREIPSNLHNLTIRVLESKRLTNISCFMMFQWNVSALNLRCFVV